MWWRRLENKIKELRKDLSQLESSKDKDVSNVRHWQTLERKYSIRLKTLSVVIEELRQRIVAIASKSKRQGIIQKKYGCIGFWRSQIRLQLGAWGEL